MVTRKASPRPLPVPGEHLDPATMPAHWLLARLGKKVMRPGGLPVTRSMLDGLAIGPGDDVVDLAPGLGVTVRLVEAAGPASFCGVERTDRDARRAELLTEQRPYRCQVAEPEATGLPSGSASVVYGEACLSLETDTTKQRIISEAARLLRPGGRLGLHELLLTPDDLADDVKHRIEVDLTRSVRVRARPLTMVEWRRMLEAGGFEVRTATPAAMLLLSPPTVVRDEGWGGTARLLVGTLRSRVVTRRVVDLWRTMTRYRGHLGAVAIVAVRKPD